MTVYKATPQSDSNLEVTLTESDDLVKINIQPAALSIVSAVTSVQGLTGAVVLDSDDISEGSTNLYYTDARVNTLLGTKGYATETYVDTATANTLTSANAYTDTAVANLVDSAPGTLDTLNELAAALGDDANFATTVTANIASGDATTLSTANAYTDTQIAGIDTFSGDYNDLTNTPTIPVNNNQLTNGAGYITDYTVTESDVTNHQAALSITESQISDLSHYDDFDTDFAAKAAADLSYDPSAAPNMTATNVKAALDHLDNNKLEKSAMGTSVVLYPTDTASGISNYNLMVDSITDSDYDTTAVNIATPEITADDQLVGAVVTEAGILNGSPGHITVHTVGEIRRTSGILGGSAGFYYTVVHRTSGGTETVMGTSTNTPTVTNSDYEDFFADALLTNPQTFTATDRLVIKYYSTDVTGTPNYEFLYGGGQPVTISVPVPVNIVVQDQAAEDVETDTANFAGLLSSSDTTVQLALDTLDNVSIPADVSDLTDTTDLLKTAETISGPSDDEVTITNNNGGKFFFESDFNPSFDQTTILQQFKVDGTGRIFTNRWKTGGDNSVWEVVKFQDDDLDDGTGTTEVRFYGDEVLYFAMDHPADENAVNFEIDADVIGLRGNETSFNRGDDSVILPTGRGSNGQVLTTNGNGNANWQTPDYYTDADVKTLLRTSTATDGQQLVWDTSGGGIFVWQDPPAGGSGGSSTLGGLDDVTITSVADGDLLRYNGTASEWQNTNLGLTVTPSVTFPATVYAGQATEVSVANHATYDDPHYFCQVKDSGGTVVVTNDNITRTSPGVFSFTAPTTGTGYVFELKAQDFGDLESELNETTFDITQLFGWSARYIRLADFTTNNDPNDMMYSNIRFYTSSGQSGTALPSNMTSTTAPSPFVITTSTNDGGYPGYDVWKAFDSSTLSSYWTLGTSSAVADAWITIDLGASYTINSMTIRTGNQSGDCTNGFTIYTSDTGAFSGEETQRESLSHSDSANTITNIN